MKKQLFYIGFSLLCMHTTVTFAESGTTVDAEIARLNTMIVDSFSGVISGNSGTTTDIELNAAPVLSVVNTIPPGYNYSPWELLHRTAMLAWLSWTGAVGNYITPAMYVGTPIGPGEGGVIYGYDVDAWATTYDECVYSEAMASFWVGGGLLTGNSYDELRDIAKFCATEYYGSYFTGKDYTTREEMLMMLFSLFGEEVYMNGTFENGVHIPDMYGFTFAWYKNVSHTAWYAPYLKHAKYLGMIAEENSWDVAREVTDQEIDEMLMMYSEYRMGYTGENLIQNAVIYTPYGRFMIGWNDDGSMNMMMY